jgi:Fur family transcriptional regulator, ferric uptake regulator
LIVEGGMLAIGFLSREGMMASGLTGRRQTQQREAILAAIQEAPGPLSVPEIHRDAMATQPALGVSTVYRAVKRLQETGDILLVSLPGDTVRYEAADLAHHHHFRCTACERVFDLPGCLLPIPDGTALPGGFRVTGHELTLTGVCPDCGPGRREDGHGA